MLTRIHTHSPIPNVSYLDFHCFKVPFLCFLIVLERYNYKIPKDVLKYIYESLTKTSFKKSELIFNEAVKKDEDRCLPYWNHFPITPKRGIVGIFCADRCDDWGMFVVDSFDKEKNIMYITHALLKVKDNNDIVFGDQMLMSPEDFKKELILKRNGTACECPPVQYGDDGFCRCGFQGMYKSFWINEYFKESTQLEKWKIYPYNMHSQSRFIYIGFLPKNLVNENSCVFSQDIHF